MESQWLAETAIYWTNKHSFRSAYYIEYYIKKYTYVASIHMNSHNRKVMKQMKHKNCSLISFHCVGCLTYRYIKNSKFFAPLTYRNTHPHNQESLMYHKSTSGSATSKMKQTLSVRIKDKYKKKIGNWHWEALTVRVFLDL